MVPNGAGWSLSTWQKKGICTHIKLRNSNNWTLKTVCTIETRYNDDNDYSNDDDSHCTPLVCCAHNNVKLRYLQHTIGTIRMGIEGKDILTIRCQRDPLFNLFRSVAPGHKSWKKPNCGILMLRLLSERSHYWQKPSGEPIKGSAMIGPPMNPKKSHERKREKQKEETMHRFVITSSR